jgi:hypothetical protein
MRALTTLTLTYGVVEPLDMMLSVPFLKLGASASNDTPGTHGMGDLGLDVKWRFYEKDKLSIAVKSGLTFPTGDDLLNLGAGRHTWSAYLISSYAQEQWAFHLHLGYLHFSNTKNDRVSIWHASASASAAVEFKLTDDLRIVMDTGADTNTNPEASQAVAFLITGLVYSPRTNFDVDVGYKILNTESLRANALLTGLALRW